MTGYQRYQELAGNWAAEYLAPVYESHKKGKNIHRGEHSFFEKFFRGFTEISDAIDALKLVEIIVSVAPPRSTRIDRVDYLKLNISSYLHEVYILRERLKAYTTTLTRVYSSTPRGADIKKSLEPLIKNTETLFDRIVKVRGRHVHKYRFIDEQLNDLTGLSLASQFNTDFSGTADSKYESTRRALCQRIRENNSETMNYVDTYFDIVFDAVTDDGEVIVP